MAVRKLSYDLQKKAMDELSEDPNRIEEDLQHVRDWLQKQNHLSARLDDQFLIAFLRGSKWSLQKTKQKIDNHYTIRNFLSEHFTDRDPFLPEIQNVLKAGVFYPLPNTSDPAGPRIVYFNVANGDPEKTPFVQVFKVIFMSMDVLLQEDDNINVTGYQIIANFANASLNFLLQITPSLAKKFLLCIIDAYPSRFKNYFAINTPTVIDTLINNVGKPFLSEKLRSRVYVYSSNNTANLYDVLDKSLLPQEMGGQNGSLPQIAEQWKAKIESYRDWFLDDVRYGTNEKLRMGLSNKYVEKFGLEGSFRKLNLD